MLYSPPFYCHALVSIPFIVFAYLFRHWPDVWLATVIPSFAWAITIVLVMYYVITILCYVIWYVTYGWTTR